MMRNTSLLLLAMLVALLSGCAVAPIPDVAYYRMPAAQVAGKRERPAFEMPIVVDTFVADGLYGNQAILYATSPTGSVRSYHYQLWNDPPVRLLQRRLIRRLRDEGISPMVADRLPTNVAALQVSGLIDRFERVKHDDGWHALVQVEMRAEILDQGLPLVLKTYSAREPADSESIQATVRAFARATDQILAEFAADLALVEP